MSMLKRLRTMPALFDLDLEDYLAGFVEGGIIPEKAPSGWTLKRVLREQAVMLNVQNVADYYWVTPQDRWFIRDDFPSVAPPWEVAWFQWRRPSRPPKSAAGDVGALMITTVLPNEQQRLPEQLTALPNETHVKWQVLWLVFSEVLDRIFSGAVLLPVSNVGRAVPCAIKQDGTHSYFVAPYFKDLTTKLARGGQAFMGLHEQVKAALLTELNVPLLALTFAACGNTKVVERPEGFVPKNDKLRRQYEAAHGPLIRWSELEIGGAVKLVGPRDESSPTGLKRALHLARGHFKDYSEGRGLFGKVHGLWWWQPQARGTDQQRRVIKDYKVKV